MHISLITCGLMDANYKTIFNEYKKRITKYSLSLKEINIKLNLTHAMRIEKESSEIMNSIMQIKEKTKFLEIILLDIYGINHSSEELSNIIYNEIISSKNIIFIIGGSNGVSDEVKKNSNKKISFGKNTWPHNLVKIMLIEQIFRAESIFFGGPYHK